MKNALVATACVGPDVLIWVGERRSPVRAEPCSAGQVGHPSTALRTGSAPRCSVATYAIFFSTSAEFFDPKPTQLQMACSIWALRPMSGT